MRNDQQIRINQLLLEREALFVRIHALEAGIVKILGEPYPFTRPVLPSDQRTKRKIGAAPKTSLPAAAPVGVVRDRLRRLEENESAYRVVYQHAGRTVTEMHDDLNALRTFLASQGARLQVLSIETLDDSGAIKERLFGL